MSRATSRGGCGPGGTEPANVAEVPVGVHPAGSDPGGSGTAGSSQRSGRRSGHDEHAALLFAERAALPDGHPERERLREELIARHLPVARRIARRYNHRGEPSEDLEQVASVGLLLAVDRFNPERDVDFLTYAVPTITGELLRHFRDRATTIRVPRRLRALQGRMYDAAAVLAQRLGRAARPSEIARHLGVDVEVVVDGLAARTVGYAFSFDEPASDDEGRGGSADRGRFDAVLAHVEPEFDLVEHRESLAPLLASLPERERRILLLRFFGHMTQTEIAAQVGISQMHVSRVLSRTLTRLRCQLAGD